ncbi:hypothetical protein EV644_1167 [Kribbella orskensis]|uniref:Uncharacterized protein n=1 Tax=Kribbella orskensis TaxID=2512216 RepID=A0ABY2BEQ3_9ACTN|nr:hypothetical protein EV642_1177 [Kribbella sp. VKM Ac-2500]TCO16638.1 hypothetical protein EV644_1167 [Kribbella orskensis]
MPVAIVGGTTLSFGAALKRGLFLRLDGAAEVAMARLCSKVAASAGDRLRHTGIGRATRPKSDGKPPGDSSGRTRALHSAWPFAAYKGLAFGPQFRDLRPVRQQEGPRYI